ncbi:MAG: AroM family protein [Rhodospirillales bacterium]|nr:AroM family protein [Rhodospirillales bacterium]
MKRVGLITIGQSPRTDIVPEIRQALGDGFEVIERGALNNLSKARIAALAPEAGDTDLVAKLTDGTTVVVGKAAIAPLLQHCLDEIDGFVDAAAVLCAGRFPELRCRVPLLEIDHILSGCAHAVSRNRQIGVLVPLASQVPSVEHRWRTQAFQVSTAVGSPYMAEEQLCQGARHLRNADVDTVVLGCMGFTQSKKALVAEIVRVPVLLPSTLLASFLREVT